MDEPSIPDLTRKGVLCWFDDTVQKRPGEVVIDPAIPTLYDFARAVRWARRTGRWRLDGWPSATWTGTRGEWAAAVVLAELDYLKVKAKSSNAVSGSAKNDHL